MQKFDLQSRGNEGILHKTLYIQSFYSHWNEMAKGKKRLSLHNYLWKTQCKIDFLLFSLKYILYFVHVVLKSIKKFVCFNLVHFIDKEKCIVDVFFNFFRNFLVHMLEIFKYYLSTEAILV